jgi:aryl-alcohol dehydrogenase-like predicted oxidoreductase
VELIQQIADRNNATPEQIALAWILAQKPWIAPIPGTTKIHRLKENVGAASVLLSFSDLQEIEMAVSEMTIQGNRYPESSQKMIDNN